MSVRGDVTIDGNLVQLRAIDIPAEQFVELRTLIPRSGFTSTAGMQVRSGPALESIAQEEQEDAAAYERDRKRLDDALASPLRPLLVLLALAFLPALAVVALVWWLWGRERGSGYDREYEQEPPTDTEPALVPPLLSQGGSAGSLEFTATLFDLIRRGRYKATPVTTERKIWAGMRTQEVADLELTLADVETPVESFEAPVASVVDSLVQDGPERLSLFRDRIESDRTANSERFTDFKSAVGATVKPWFRSDGLVLLVRRHRRFRCARRDPPLAGDRPAGDVRAPLGRRAADRLRRLRARERRRRSWRRRSTVASGAAAPRPPSRRRSAGRHSAAT